MTDRNMTHPREQQDQLTEIKKDLKEIKKRLKGGDTDARKKKKI